MALKKAVLQFEIARRLQQQGIDFTFKTNATKVKPCQTSEVSIRYLRRLGISYSSGRAARLAITSKQQYHGPYKTHAEKAHIHISVSLLKPV
ncbi:MAG: hypothetical protein AMXMBFR13_23910 [Phycisphaerae bacterium]